MTEERKPVKARQAIVMSPTVLVAESDLNLVELYRKHFVESGYRVLTASEGSECLAIIRRESPAVLVAALEMPWGAGGGLVACLREESRKRPVPSLILTGFAADDCIADWSDPFLVRYLRKPVTMAELLECVHAAQSRPHGWRLCRVGQTFESFSTAGGI